ncbi:MAG: tetratricopeptide repeat protein [Magnetococcus sp. DMHC-8]
MRATVSLTATATRSAPPAIPGGLPGARTLKRRPWQSSGLVVLVLGLWWLPLVAAAPPEMVHEEVLSGQEPVGGQPLLSVGLARRLLAAGSTRLVLRVADDALSRGGAPLAAADWLRLKAEALMLLDQFDALQALVQEMPEEVLTAYPDLTLLVAAGHRESGCCEEARRLYAAFLLAHPQHPRRFQAQLGIGLCALEQNALEEAELQLRLYEQDPDRPKQDLLLQLGLAELARHKGQPQEEGALMVRVAEAAAPVEPLARRARWMALANWEARQRHWPAAIAWVEHGLRQEGPLPRLLRLHAHLLRQWLTGKEPGAMSGEHRHLPEPVQRAAEQRMFGLKAVLRSDGKPVGAGDVQRLALLDGLLRQEAQEGLGLLEEGGILQPEDLWEGPVPELYRLAYAEYERGRGDLAQAWYWLEGLTGAEADGQRLLLLASCTGTESGAIVAVLERLAKVTEWSEALKSRAIKALFVLTAQGRQAPMLRLREQLAALSPQTRDVQRALLFHQAQLWVLEGNSDRALVEWLSLATAPQLKPEDNRYLPEEPRLAAARLLEEQGWPGAARELRRR